jgi:hypothetical protein
MSDQLKSEYRSVIIGILPQFYRLMEDTNIHVLMNERLERLQLTFLMILPI